MDISTRNFAAFDQYSVYGCVMCIYHFVVSVVYRMESITNFSLPLLAGNFISGCYSSICIAGPLWVWWEEHREKFRKKDRAKENEEINMFLRNPAARQNDRGRICGSDSVRDACAASSHIGKGWCRGHSDDALFTPQVQCDRLIAIDTADHLLPLVRALLQL